MISMLSKKMSSFFVKTNVIAEADREVYNYSLELLIATVLNIVILSILAIVTKTVWQTVLFVVGFVPFRFIAGGYHAKTHFRCLLVLLINYAAFLSIIYFLPPTANIYISIACLLFSVITILIFAPVEHKNKPLSKMEKTKLRKKVIVLLAIYLTALVICICLWSKRIEFVCVGIGMTSVALSMIAAKVRNKLVSNG